MPKSTTNFGTSFRSAVNRGTPASTAVWNLAQKSGRSEQWIWNWLHEHKFVSRRKINGTWVYWPNFNRNGRSKANSQFKSFSFQQIINWAIASGYCTPQQVNNLKNQKDFFNFFGPFFAQQFGWTVLSGWTPSKVKSFSGHGTVKATATKSRKTKRAAKAKKNTRRSTKRTATTRAKSAKPKVNASKPKRNSRKSTTKAVAATTTRNYKFPARTTGRRIVRKAA